MLAGKLTIAIIHHDSNIRRDAFYGCAYIAYLLRGKSSAVFIAS